MSEAGVLPAGGRAGETTELDRLRAQVAALEQLLEVHEQTSLHASARLEQSVRERDVLLARERASHDRLLESEERLRLAMDAGRMGSWEWDIAGQRVIWSPEEERLYGLPPGSFSGTLEEYRERIHPDDRVEALALAQRALEARAATHHVTHRIVRPDGEVRWLDSHARFLFDSQGAPIRLVGVSTDITERRAVEEARDRALAEAGAERKRLHEVFMQAPAAITVLEGPEHRFTVVNPLYRVLVGGRDLEGLPVRQALPELEGQGFYELLDRVYQSGEPFVANEMLVRLDRDGDGVLEDLWVDFVYQPLTDADGRVFGIMAHAVETTEHVRARRHVEALAAERAAIVGQIADVVITTDMHGTITFANAAADTVYGSMRVGVPIWDASQPFTLLELDGTVKPVERVALSRAVRGERVLNEEWRVRRADGGELQLLGSAVPLRTPDGRQFGAVMTVRDVTGARRLQRELEVERTRLREVLMQAPAAISVTEGPDHVVVFQNAASKQLVGGRDLTGMRAAEALPDEEVRPLLDIVDRVFATGEPFLGSEVHVRFDRSGAGDMVDRYFNLVYQPMRDVEGRVYAILSHSVDITEQVLARRQVEEKAEELARLTRELEQSNRELDQFAYVASHDLKAPLRGIANLTQWIEEDLGERVTGESREHMELLKGRVHRMEALIDGILTYSRAGRVRERAEPIEPGALVREVVELLAPPEGVEVEVAGSFPPLVAERIPLQQVLMNLVGNAIKHSPRPGARVVVSAAPVADGFVQFDVRDNGPGIPAQYHDRIWEIFQTLAPRDKVEGTGIGLSVVRKLVDARGGRAWVDSADGQGATFHFTWPERPRTTS
jgi:PAS domain S-box-containing protein